MGNGMNKILPGLYIGDCRDARDTKQLEDNNISDILAVFDMARPIFAEKNYLCIKAEDSPTQNLKQYFSQSNLFIHKARMEGRSVLVHCMAGMSRSVTLVVAYVMAVTDLGWKEALNAVRGARHSANPNFGFQRQLLTYQEEMLQEERQILRELYPDKSNQEDIDTCRRLLEAHRDWMINGNDADDHCIQPSQFKSMRSQSRNNEAPSTSNQSDYSKALMTGLLPSSSSGLEEGQNNKETGCKSNVSSCSVESEVFQTPSTNKIDGTTASSLTSNIKECHIAEVENVGNKNCLSEAAGGSDILDELFSKSTP